MLLASPIILYDHPAIAPESPGDLFDALEIDEILTLRTMTLTEDEKRQPGERIPVLRPSSTTWTSFRPKYSIDFMAPFARSIQSRGGR